MDSSDLLKQFIKQHDGKVPHTKVNWASTNSDISFIWTFHYLAVFDLYHAVDTQAERETCLDILREATRWVFSMTDKALGADHKANVITSWNPRQEEPLSLSLGYAHSPSKELNPGWSRYIDVGGGKMGFRPEILASGMIGYAIALFIRDCIDHIDRDEAFEWLSNLKDIFLYHEPNWRDDYRHSAGESFGEPFPSAEVSGYFWPSDRQGGVYSTMPGLNQQVQFLCMGAVTEAMIGHKFGAHSKLQKFMNDTLPLLVKTDSEGRVTTAYDLRAHSNMSPAMAEPTNDSTHSQHSIPIFIEQARWYQAGIIKQLQEVTHLGNGKMSVLMDGTSEHGGENGHKYHPGIAHLADALLFENGHELLPIAEKALQVDFPDDIYSHKGIHYHARVARIKAAQRKNIRPDPPAMSISQPKDYVEVTDTGKKSKRSKGKLLACLALAASLAAIAVFIG